MLRLEQLQAWEMAWNFLLQNAPFALVERIGIGRAGRPHQLPPPRRARRLDGGGRWRCGAGAPFFSSSLRYRACLELSRGYISYSYHWSR